MKWILPLIFILLISGCSSQLELGNQQYELGNYNQAAFYWNPAAQAGDPYAQFNVGLLWEGGLGNTPKNKHEASQWFLLSAKQGFAPAMVKLAKIQFESDYNEAAISWLNLAARWNNAEAKTILSSKGLTSPYPDLHEQQQINEAVAFQNYANILAGVIGAYSGTYSPPKNTTPTYQSAYRPQAQKQITTPTVQVSECSSDYQCTYGQHCVKGPMQSKGLCVQTVNQYGQPIQSQPRNNSFQPNISPIGQCTFNSECPIGFECNSRIEICVKRQ
jgi:hypothetical protein